MRRQMMSLALMVGGALILLLGAVIGPAPLQVSAMPVLQPSPRPTLQPTPDLRTATPAPVSTAVPEDNTGGYREPTPVPYGRVTGTVIDLRTNAPASNVLVVVGDALVITDANGNYDRWVESGYYQLGLQLGSDQGQPIQGFQEIAVGPNDTVVVHLFFTSPAPVFEVLVPTPTAVVTVPIAAPSVVPAAEPPVAAAPSGSAPDSLPETAVPGTAGPGLWMVGGALLLAFGLAMQFMPRRRHAAQQRLLDRLLHQAPARSNDDVLRDLLDRDM
ncbi:MAG: carboxypeptidase-like regulatory domain-containing protein [Blastochloris sp.]|nr:carboxypeptidase-like regulatory domain-containing protein [Blastochloris sp.]